MQNESSPCYLQITYFKIYVYRHMYIFLYINSSNYVSQLTVETYCFADGRCLFKQSQSVIYHWNKYDEEISKKCRSVRLSICNANKKAYSSIIDSRIIIRISGERAYHRLQENQKIFSKKYFSKISERIIEKFCTLIKCLLLFHYKQKNNNSRIRWKGLASSTRNWSDIF